MGTLILARSGTTDFDEQHRILGNLDVPMNVQGQAEVDEMARELNGFSVDVVYSSVGESARESASRLADALGAKFKILEDLKNLDMGLWQGLQVSEVQRKHRRLYRQWSEHPCDTAPPAGEMLDEAACRVKRSLKPVIRKCQHSDVVLVAPDPLRQLIRCQLTDTDIDSIWETTLSARWEALPVG